MIVTSKPALEQYRHLTGDATFRVQLNTATARANITAMLTRNIGSSEVVESAKRRLEALDAAERIQRIENWRAEGKALGMLV